MTLIKIPKGWELPESAVTPQGVYRSRREVLRQLGLGAIGLTAAGSGCFLSVDDPTGAGNRDVGIFDAGNLYPAPRNELFQVPERPLTDFEDAMTFNNFYEFSVVKDRVWQLVDRFETDPWTIEVKGLCNQPQTFDLDDLLAQIDLEERIYRFRCVEAWAMTVPWTGFPLSALLNLVEPTSEAKYVRMVSVSRPEQMPGMDAFAYPWPYYEGLSIDEAMNELTLMVTGLYGEQLPRQNGAPFRLIVPWKYGYKSIKSIIEIELVAEEPGTFWNTLVPNEYGFESNVDPEVPHPRWSQARETLLGSGDRVDTMQYNGYGDYVAHLYA